MENTYFRETKGSKIVKVKPKAYLEPGQEFRTQYNIYDNVVFAKMGESR